MISVIIPSYKDPLVHKTIDNLLAQALGKIEIVVVLDGYEPKEKIIPHPWVKQVRLGENKGMREAINVGVNASTGGILMRADEHQMFSHGYDVELTRNLEPNWIVTPRRYFLDPEKWVRMEIKPIDCEKLVIDKKLRKFAAVRWTGRDEETEGVPIVEKMAMQGSCWVMHRSWWDECIKSLQTRGYGTHYQDSIEMIFKTWQRGGKLMLNRNAWHAHKHRKFSRTHHYPNKLAKQSFAYALGKWESYYNDEVKPKWGM